MSSSGPDRHAESRLTDFLALVSELDVDSVLRRTADAAASWTGADLAVVRVLEPVRGARRWVATGVPEDEVRDVLEALPEGDRVLRARIDADGAPFAELVVVVDAPEAKLECYRYWLSGLCRVAGVAVRNARSFSLNERRREWAEATARVTESLHPPYDLAEPVQCVAEGAQRIVRAAFATIVRAAEAGYDVAATVHDHSPQLPVLLEELRPAISASQRDGKPFEIPHGRGTVAGIPLNPELAFEGVVVVVTDDGAGALSAEDHELLDSFVTHGSLVLDRAVLLRERQRAVVAADRDRIARDLHDVVIQRLFATGMRLQATRHVSEPGVHDEQVQEAVRELDVTIRDIRSTIFDLERGSEASLRAGVAALVREYEPALGFLPVVRTWGALNSLVSSALADQALAVLREALSNCARHAGAASCLVEITVDDGWVVLEVLDDGRGPGDADEDVHHSGLRNLRRRAEELGGELRVTPGDEGDQGGTRVTWRVPTQD